jgi:hypothetical protein
MQLQVYIQKVGNGHNRQWGSGRGRRIVGVGQDSYRFKIIDQTIYRKPRVFISVECLGCRGQFPRESKLMNHLNQSYVCMVTMGGNANAARKIVKSIKDKKRIADNPDLVKERNKVAYRNNPEGAKERRKNTYRNDPEPDKRRQRQDYLSNSGRYGPSFPCIVCHELHWHGNTVVVNVEGIDEQFLCTDYIHRNSTLFLKLGKYHCCNMCKRKTDSGDMPKVAAKNNLECPWDNMPGKLLKLNEVRVFFFFYNV